MRRDQAVKRGEQITGDESFMYFMAIHYPESHLKIMDYNRVLRSLNGLSTLDFLDQLSHSYHLEGPFSPEMDPKPTLKGYCSLYIDKQWYSLRVKPDKVDRSDLTKQLDS